MTTSKRLNDIVHFYTILGYLEEQQNQKSILSQSSGLDPWPQRGVYFFFELNQKRKDSGSGLRVTRIGTHALKTGSKTSLWNRLSQHKGVVKSGGGNHRGSIFRLLIGTAIISRDNLSCPTWGQGSSASKEIRESELILEQLVSQAIGKMPFLYLAILDDANSDSMRGYIERNCIALLSNYDKHPIDPASSDWLGRKCNREKVVHSGLWNQKHVDEDYSPEFIEVFQDIVTNQGKDQ